MTVLSKDLLLAILAMDSYNRGYGAGIDIGDVDVGPAVYNDHVENGISPEDYQAWQSAGFYALSYTVGEGVDGLAAGSTVISVSRTDAAPDAEFLKVAA